MSEPLSVLIPDIEEYIIDAERLLINFYRISIYKSNFIKVVEIINENTTLQNIEKDRLIIGVSNDSLRQELSLRKD